MKKIQGSLLVILLIVVFLLANSLYILDQRKTAIIIQFGKVIGEQLEPGLKFKLPLISTMNTLLCRL